MVNDEVGGFLLVDKEKGYTSFDVCNKLKHKFKFRKVGHNGTLDPNATGLMIIGVNSYTKLLFKLNYNIKEYIATILFGMESKTYDITGEVFNECKFVDVNESEIDNAINSLKNIKTQIPPMYSAIKVNGKKLYDLAREGIEIELKPREIEIYNIKRLTDIYLDNGFKCMKITMTVSSGFYVRSFVRDLGELLKLPCLLKDLIRTKNGKFNLTDAKKIDEITINDIIHNIRLDDNIDS